MSQRHCTVRERQATESHFADMLGENANAQLLCSALTPCCCFGITRKNIMFN